MARDLSPADPVDQPATLSRSRFVVHDAAPTDESSPTADNADPGFPEAGAVHRLLKALQGIGNEVRLRFLDALRALHDGNLCIELGYSSFHQYCDRELGLARSTSYEYLRVAQALDGLPRLRVLFGQGELSWEQARAITRVAAADTEVAWIEMAFEEPVQRLLAEVREAQRTGRAAPRERRHGLPNLMVRLCLDLTLEEKERVRAAFAVVSSGPGPNLGGGPEDSFGHDADGAADVRPPLVRWADGILSGAIPAWPAVRDGGAGGAPDRLAPAQTILYRTCPECRAATLDTADGPVSVPPERVEQLAAVSGRVVIGVDDELSAEVLPPGQVDEPNSPRLARQVLHRDGLRCANPACDRRHDLHAHHIVFRANGGRTVLANEVAVCDTCHALLHKGLLEVIGAPDTGLAWRRHPAAAGVKLRDAEALRRQLRAMAPLAPDGRWRTGCVPRGRPDAHVPSVGAEQSAVADTAAVGVARRVYGVDIGSSPGASGTPQAAVAACHPAAGGRGTAGTDRARDGNAHGDGATRIGTLVEGLQRLGFNRAEGEGRVRAAIVMLMAGEPQVPWARTHDPEHEAAIVMQALRL